MCTCFLQELVQFPVVFRVPVMVGVDEQAEACAGFLDGAQCGCFFAGQQQDLYALPFH